MMEYNCAYPSMDAPDEFSDIILIVEDKELYTCKSLLAGASPIFKNLFLTEYKDVKALELSLPGKKYRDVVEMLLCIHPGIMKPVSSSNVFAVLPLAEEFEIGVLKSRCEHILLSVNERDSVHLKLRYFLLAEKYKMQTLFKKTFWLLSRTDFNRFSNFEEFKNMDTIVKYGLLCKRSTLLETASQRIWCSLNKMLDNISQSSQACEHCQANEEEMQQIVNIFKSLDIPEHKHAWDQSNENGHHILMSYLMSTRDFGSQVENVNKNAENADPNADSPGKKVRGTVEMIQPNAGQATIEVHNVA